MHLPARLTDPWFEAHFYGYVGVSPEALETARIRHENGESIAFSESQGLFLWCPCGYGLLDKDGKERYPLDLSFNLGRPHGVIVPFSNPPSGVALPPTHGPTSRDKSHHPR